MIVRITFDNGNVMLFGNSYKSWYGQFEEYMWDLKRDFITVAPVKIESCKDRWIGWGGLKWCQENLFQQQLNREGCQYYEPDNPNPRLYKNMKFVENELAKHIVQKLLRSEG
jgi:hypothetical protein